MENIVKTVYLQLDLSWTLSTGQTSLLNMAWKNISALHHSKKHLLENLLRIIHNCRFFLEESLYRLEINPNEMMYQTLYDPFIEVLLNLRFGVFFTHVPRISDFSTLTENGLQVKIRSIKRFFYPKVKDLIVKLSKYCTHPLKKYMITCRHQSVSDLSSIKFHKEDWQDRTGPIYPPSFRKYYFCKICYVNESNKCLHWIIFSS